LPEGHISPEGYHLAQQQVGGASALSNVMYILRYFGENFNLLAATEKQSRVIVVSSLFILYF
jgi:hypothetical protein